MSKSLIATAAARRLLAATVLSSGLLVTAPVAQSQQAAAETRLRDPGEFAHIQDRAERSRALFVEAGKVIQHPRCVNCHPPDDWPRQGMDSHPHIPLVVRGADNHGVPAMYCDSCHQQTNVDHGQVPGHPRWHLAPLSMAWHGKTLAEICEQTKDRRRNGGKTLAEIVDHMAHDSLVGWGWQPGAGREPVPGTQQQFGALIAAWAETGAECPRP